MLHWRIFILLLLFHPVCVRAGGSALNLVVVVNENSTNSVQLGNDYCEKRGVPPQNVFRMTGWTGGNTTWSRAECEANLRGPLLSMLSSAGLSHQIQYVLLSMDIPYRVVDGDSANSTTSFIYYGFKTNTVPPPDSPTTCSLPDYSSNSIAFMELPFDQSRPDTAPTNGFLTFMLTDDTLAGAQAILARAVGADSSFPTQAVYLQKTSDLNRAVRFFSFDNAIFDSRIRGDASVARVTSDSTAFDDLRGLLTGFTTLTLSSNAFVPGGVGDNLTSFGGYIFEPTGQTTLLAFLDAGAAASYGTVIEPCNYLQKFPDPLVFFYQTRGFSLAEAYYESVLNPYQGLLVGEPLCAPFALSGQPDWFGLTNGIKLNGLVSLPTAAISSASALAPLDQVDLFLDGTFMQSLTNVPPAPANVLSVSLNGSEIKYTVPENSTLRSVTAGLAAALNLQSNDTRVIAFATGDRIELQGWDLATVGGNVSMSSSVSAGTSGAITIFPSVSRPFFLDTVATGYVGLTVTNSVAQGDWLQIQVTKTNGSLISLSVTNTTGETNLALFCLSLMNEINAEPALQTADGVVAADLYSSTDIAEFFLYARTAGWAPAQLNAELSSSSDLVVIPAGKHPLQDNLTDLRPRNHLYLSSGFAQLSVSPILDTTRIPDGAHDLTLVGYEGTSVRTQTRVSRSVRVQNTSLSATLTPNFTGTNVTLAAPLVFSVSVNTNSISRIELFSTGGSIGVVSNQSPATFTVPASLLGVGLHPFYALVTDALGQRYQTDRINIRIVPSIQVSISGPPFVLSWPAVPAVSYDVFSSTNLASGFQKAGTVLSSGLIAQWPVPAQTGNANFFKVGLTP